MPNNAPRTPPTTATVVFSPLQSLSTELGSLQAVTVPVVALVVLLEEEVGEGINLPTAQLESAVTIALTSSQQFPGSGSAFAPYH